MGNTTRINKKNVSLYKISEIWENFVILHEEFVNKCNYSNIIFKKYNQSPHISMTHSTKGVVRRITAVIIGLFFVSAIHAQVSDSETQISLKPKDNNVFRHLDLGVSVGTTGLGLNLSTHVTDYVRIRTGVDFTPHIAFPMSFSLQSYSDGAGVTANNFEKLQNYMHRLTGIEVDDRVEMDGKPTMTNFKMLFDIYPWKNKGWRATVGFYIGSKKVAKALNTMGEMPSLVAVNIYNNFYDFIMSDDAIDQPIFGDTYLDPFLVDDIRADLESEGHMGIHIGDFKDGKPYMMQPDKDGMVKANAYANVFRPYVGLGYTGPLTKNKRLNFDVDCGMMMWGGSPRIVTHDGVDLTTEVVNIKGKPGDYVDFFKGIKVYPVLTFTLSYRLF